MKYQSSSEHSMFKSNKQGLSFPKKLFKLQGQKVKNNGTHGKFSSQGILRWNIKALDLTVQKLLAKLKFSKKWVKLQGKVHRVKNNGIHGKVISQGIFMWNIKALSLIVQKL